MSVIQNESLHSERSQMADSLEARPSKLSKHPKIEIDLSQPDLAKSKGHTVEGITNSKMSRVIAEISSPDGYTGVIITPFENFSIISVAELNPETFEIVDPEAFETVDPGEARDISKGQQGKCVVELSQDGTQLFVFAPNPDMNYTLLTKRVELIPQAPNYDPSIFDGSGDDPEL